MNKSISIQVYGKVQGVFFRQSTREKAIALKVTGVVRNEPDGSVTIQATGDAAALRLLVDWCKVGPSRARVDRIVELDIVEQHFKSFEIQK